MARVPDVSPSDMDDSNRNLLISMRDGEPRNIYQALGHNPEFLQAFRDFASALWNHTGLDPYTRELVILHVGRITNSEYEWHQHVAMAFDEGVSRDDILAIASGDLDHFDEREEVILRYASDVIADEVDESAVSTVRKFVPDDGAVVGTTGLASSYLMLARMLRALDVEIEGEFVGWRLENI